MLVFLSFRNYLFKYRLLIIAIGILIAFFLYILTSKTLLGIRIKAGQNDREMISVLGVNIKTLIQLFLH